MQSCVPSMWQRPVRRLLQRRPRCAEKITDFRFQHPPAANSLTIAYYRGHFVKQADGMSGTKYIRASILFPCSETAELHQPAAVKTSSPGQGIEGIIFESKYAGERAVSLRALRRFSRNLIELLGFVSPDSETEAKPKTPIFFDPRFVMQFYCQILLFFEEKRRFDRIERQTILSCGSNPESHQYQNEPSGHRHFFYKFATV